MIFNEIFAAVRYPWLREIMILYRLNIAASVLCQLHLLLGCVKNIILSSSFEVSVEIHHLNTAYAMEHVPVYSHYYK